MSKYCLWELGWKQTNNKYVKKTSLGSPSNRSLGIPFIPTIPLSYEVWMCTKWFCVYSPHHCLSLKKARSLTKRVELFFLFFVDRVLAVLSPIFARCPIFPEPIEPCWESNRTCQPDLGRGVKYQSLGWERGSGSNARPPVRELARWTTRPHRRPKSRTINSKYKKSFIRVETNSWFSYAFKQCRILV